MENHSSACGPLASTLTGEIKAQSGLPLYKQDRTTGKGLLFNSLFPTLLGSIYY